MSKKQFFIGKDKEYQAYLDKPDTENLPIKNLPMCYFPFFYNTNEASIEKIRRLVPLLDASGTMHNIDMDALFGNLTTLEDPEQPFNKNNTNHIFYVVIISWILIGAYVLKMISLFLPTSINYVVFIVSLIFMLLIFAVLWTLFITNSVYNV